MAYELISKSIKNKRNYHLSRFGLECKVENSVFTMIHYGTPILKVDLYEGKVLGYGGYSQTDSAYINHALREIAERYGDCGNDLRCRHSRKFNKIWLEDSEGNLYDEKMRLLDKNEVKKREKEIEKKVRHAIKIWEKRIKKDEIAGRIDEYTVKPRKIFDDPVNGTVYKRFDSDLKTIEAYVLPQSSLDESCWLNQFRGLNACYECDYLGKEECGGGYKFLYQVLEFYGYRYPEMFLCECQNKDPSKPRIFTSIEKVRENWKYPVKRALTKFYRYAFGRLMYFKH